MASPFVAEIRAVAFNKAPKGWAFCDGQLQPISQNTALLSLLVTVYGGDGKSTFALPDLQGSAAAHPKPEDNSLFQGEQVGTPAVTLIQSEMPLHTHTARAAVDVAELQAPTPERSLAKSSPFIYQSNATANLKTMDPFTLSIAGSTFPHNNMQPYLVVNFVIAMQGVFPPRG
jgi:microcystin-dependent protein